MISENELLADLVDAIDRYLEGSKSRSLSSLARRSNVAYSTIRRIAQRESIPHPFTALAICEIVMPTRDRLVFLKKHFPTIGNLMNTCYSEDLPNESTGASLRKFIGLEPHNRIFNMAATTNGVDVDTVKKLTGSLGLDALEEMIEDGLLNQSADGRVFYAYNSWALGNIDDALLQVKHSVGHFDKSLVGTEGASLMHATASISKDKVIEEKFKTLSRILHIIVSTT